MGRSDREDEDSLHTSSGEERLVRIARGMYRVACLLPLVFFAGGGARRVVWDGASTGEWSAADLAAAGAVGREARGERRSRACADRTCTPTEHTPGTCGLILDLNDDACMRCVRVCATSVASGRRWPRWSPSTSPRSARSDFHWPPPPAATSHSQHDTHTIDSPHTILPPPCRLVVACSSSV